MTIHDATDSDDRNHPIQRLCQNTNHCGGRIRHWSPAETTRFPRIAMIFYKSARVGCDHSVDFVVEKNPGKHLYVLCREIRSDLDCDGHVGAVLTAQDALFFLQSLQQVTAGRLLLQVTQASGVGR